MSVSVPRILALLAVVGAIGLVVTLSPAGAQSVVTFVDSDVTADTTWTPEQSPYRVVENVTVAPDASLSIQPGTTVQFAEGVSMHVAGGLYANGTEDQPVHLTSSRPASTPGTWGSIRTVGSGSSTITLSHTELTDATDGISVTNPDSTVLVANTSLGSIAGNGIDVKTADGRTDLEVRESRFQDIGATGIRAARTEILPVDTASGWSITDSTFVGAGEAGIHVDAKRTTGLTVHGTHFDGIDGPAVRLEADRIRASRVQANTVLGSAQGVAVDTADASALSIAENEIDVEGTAVGISLEQNVYGLEIRDNRIEEGTAGISIGHDPRRDGYYSFDLSVTENRIRNQAGSGIALSTSLFSDSEMAVQNNTVADNGRYGIRLAVGAFQQAVVADNRIAGNARSGLSMTARHVRNTNVRGNTVRENGASGIEITARAAMERVEVSANELLDNAREGLAIETEERTESNYTITANVVAANAYGVFLSGPQTGVLSENAVVFNTIAFGDRVERSDADSGIGGLGTAGATDVELIRNGVYGNRVGLQTQIDGTVSAAGNYWGAKTGPYHRSINPEGEGNAVVTEQGWVELIEVRSERVGRTYTRPTAALDVDPHPAFVDQSVTISAAQSEDADGVIQTYRFTIDGRTTVTQSATQSATFEEIGSYPVSLWVEDDMGIESADPATVLVQVEPVPTTTQAPETTAPQTAQPTTTVLLTTQPDQGGPGLFGWFGGILGAVFYGIALVFGTRGMYQTLTSQPLSVRGRRVHVLALLGVLVWAITSVPGPTVLGTIAGLGLVAWVTLTGIAYALAGLR